MTWMKLKKIIWNERNQTQKATYCMIPCLWNAHKNWCFQTVVQVKTPESPLGSKEIKPVNLKGNQPWIFAGRTDAEAPRLCHLIWRANSDFDAGKNWGQEEKGATEDKIVGWHHCLNGHEFEQTQGDSERGREAWRFSSWGSQRVRHDWATEQEQQQEAAVESWQWELTAIGHAVSFVIIQTV